MGEGFKSLSNFLDVAKKLDKNVIESALNNGVEQEVQKILSDASVRLTIMNNRNTDNSGSMSSNIDKAEFIQQGVKEAVEVNSLRMKSILDEMFENASVCKEREDFWVNRLCVLFLIDDNLDRTTKMALIDKQLAEDEDTFNYVTFLIEQRENKK